MKCTGSCVVWATVVAVNMVFAESVESIGRNVAAKFASAVVPVTAVLKVEAPGVPVGEQERPIDLFGTVVSMDGHVVLSATSLSPLNNVGNMDEEMLMGGARPTTTATRIKVRLGDGIEIPMKQVLTDDELDIALLAPEPEEGKPTRKWPSPVVFVRGVAADLCDEVFTVGRSGELFNWAPVIGRQQVICRVDQPRRMYVTAGAYSGGVGTPVFLTDGRPLGLMVVRREPAAPRPGRPLPFQQAIVVISGDDLVDVIEQARSSAAARRSGAAAAP